MTFQKSLTALCAAAGMLVLILDGRTALLGASEGLELCFRTVVPSLFPFLFLCALLTGSLWGCRWPGTRWLADRLGIPRGGNSLLLAALLGGYPAGAQAVSQAYRENRLTISQAQHLLTFCSNAGPAFLFGMIGPRFLRRDAAWALWAVHLLAAFLTGFLDVRDDPAGGDFAESRQSTGQTLARTVKTMGIICGWVVLFQVLWAFVRRWLLWAAPEPVQVLMQGLLELSAGCCGLSAIDDPELRFVMCSVFLSFGGVCVLMQTMSVIAPLSIGSYLKGKLLQTLFSLILSGLFLQLGWAALLCSGLVIFTLPKKLQKRYGFPGLSGV